MSDFNNDDYDLGEDIVAVAGKQIENCEKTTSKEKVIEALKKIEDPEIMVNIYDMGLIYKIDIKDNGNIDIDMTLTAPGCPVAGEMPQEAAEEVASLENVGKVTIYLVWEPPWSVEKMTEEARLMLDIF